VFINVAMLLLFTGLPFVVDGDTVIYFDWPKRGGEPVLTINDDVVFRRGRGAGEIEPSLMTYDPRSGTVAVSDQGLNTHLVKVADLEITKVSTYRHQVLRGVWGDYKVMMHHDFFRKRGAGGRLVLEGPDHEILVAKHDDLHSNRQYLIQFVRTRTSLVILDNHARAIGYLPTVEGELKTVEDEQGNLVPKGATWFPMPQIVRETPFYKKEKDLKLNRLMGYGVELFDGLFVLVDSQDQAYIYDLSNTSGYYLGSFELEHYIVGTKEGQLIVRDLDAGKLRNINPLELVQN
jgi:hypothetical protein